MRILLLLFAVLLIKTNTNGQVPYNAAMPNGYTKKAMVSEQIGLTQVTIMYNRPVVKGREGKIWGGVVHTGFVNQGFGNGNPAPWRAGANENTTIEIDHDVLIEGQPLARGKYALFIAYGADESIVIFSKKTNAWGSFFYDQKDDALRVKVKPVRIDKTVEWLKFEFSEETTNTALVSLSWENLSIPFKIEVDLLKQQFEALVTESQNPAGFTSQGLTIAANWTLQNNYQLEQGLAWATLASSSSFPGDPTSFNAAVTKALILDKLGRNTDFAKAIKSALPLGNNNQLFQLGRQLIGNKKSTEAMEVFQFNYDRYPNQFISLVGMARGLSATGRYEEGLKYANQALPLAPNDAGKQAVTGMIEKLKQGKDIN